MATPAKETKQRSGVVAIAGRPNVGKSTLLNRMLGQKLSIVSHKAQTTRQQVLGILTEGDCQVAFIDTPGVMEPKTRLQELMVQASFKAVSGADLAVLLVDAADRGTPADTPLLERLGQVDVPRLLAINKIDLVGEKEELLPLIAEYHRTGLFEAIVPLSALKGDGVERLLGEIRRRLPQGPFLYSPDQIATQPMRFFAAELIRETIFELLHDELPYASTVMVEDYKEREQGKIYISAVIYTERDSQKRIIIGKGGQQLKRIGQLSRVKIEEFIEAGVYLELWVKVRENWRRNEDFLNTSGFDHNL